MSVARGAAGRGALIPYLALGALVVLSSASALSLRQARDGTGTNTRAFSVWQAIFLSEVLKVAISAVGLVLADPPATTSPPTAWPKVSAVFTRADAFALTVPALLYPLQNALNYMAVSQLPAVVFQTVNQTKILMAAVFSILLLKTGPTARQWVALLLLMTGVIVSEARSSRPESVNYLFGILAALGATMLSGFTGVYLERFLTGSKVSLWTRNAQLGIYSAAVSLVIGVGLLDSQLDPPPRFFENFNAWTYAAISLQAVSGLAVAVVLRYTGSIMKNFASSLAIVLTAILSHFASGFELGLHFALGTGLIFIATWLYVYRKPDSASSADDSTVSVLRMESYKLLEDEEIGREEMDDDSAEPSETTTTTTT
ncbi:hypothetical protein HDU88_002367 [Geranomyces variabilis]|nr:hypothetical protein HDU88_002367 [Geranomyces variabilis]